MDLPLSTQLVSLVVVAILAHLWLRDRASAGPASDKVLTPQNRPPCEVLYPGPNDETAEVDIVAVHGLGSNVDWSWTWRDKTRPGSSVNWLGDPHMLPAVVPTSRIIIYNYDSRWHSNAPKTRLQLCGEDLVRNLHIFRDGVRDRPVVFVGHSLGGLVIQHGLLYADREDEFRYLLTHTVGLIALGSPFRGTKMHIIVNAAARLTLWAGSHRGIIQDLSYDNQTLRDKLREFCRLQQSTSIPICCFFELYETDYGRRFGLPGVFRGMVVPEESACVPSWDRLPLQTDHLKLNKFCGPEDRSFLRVSERISKMCSTWRNILELRTNFSSRYWMVPFGRNEGFVGREQILCRLLETIPPVARRDDCQRAALEGLGGVGKTQIALEATFRVRDNHPHCSVFWVPAVDAASFENAYREIGRLLQVAGIDEDKADVKSLVQAALSHEDAGQWLLVIDNADDIELLFGPARLSDYLPFSRSGSILFTTRTHEVAVRLDIYQKSIIATTKMSREEATEMLQTQLKESQTRDEVSTSSLLDFLDDLPLAIKQASAYIARTGMSTARYLHYCQSSDLTLVNLLSRDFEDRGRYKSIKNPIATTWLISFKHILRDSPQAGDYLRFICFLAERDIPISLLLSIDNELEVEEAIGILKAYAFIIEREEGKSFDIHRLVRLAMRSWLNEEGQARESYTCVIQRLEGTFPFPEHKNREAWMQYMPHAQRALECREECDDKDAELELLYNVAEGFFKLGNYQGAENIYRRMRRLCENVFGKEHPSTLNSMNHLAEVIRLQGKYKEAEQMHRQTLELRKKILGKEHPNTLGSMNNLALVLRRQGKYNQAEQLHRQTLELKEKILGKDHPSTLDSMNNLALVLDSQGKYKEAEDMHRRTLELTEKEFGKEHPSTLDSMTNLAEIFRVQGRHKEAEQMHQQTLELKEKVLGKEHPDTLASMNNLALVFRRQGRYEEAERMHRKSLGLKEKVLGKEHPSTLDSMNNLALVLTNQGKYQEAEQMHRKEWELTEKVLGKEHPSTLTSVSNLAEARQLQGKYEEAEQMHQQTLELREKVLGKDHPDTMDSMDYLAHVLKLQGKHEEAEQIYR